MTRIYRMTDALKTIVQGALGAVTFGAYHQFTTNRLMELNNENITLKNDIMNIQHNQDMKILKDEHRKEMDNLNEKYKQLELLVQRRNRWF
jgi:hypothetical protein